MRIFIIKVNRVIINLRDLWSVFIDILRFSGSSPNVLGDIV